MCRYKKQCVLYVRLKISLMVHHAKRLLVVVPPTPTAVTARWPEAESGRASPNEFFSNFFFFFILPPRPVWARHFFFSVKTYMLRINFYRETNFPNTSKPVVPHRNPDRRRRRVRNNGFYWPRLVLFLHGVYTHTRARAVISPAKYFYCVYTRAREFYFLCHTTKRAATILHRTYIRDIGTCTNGNRI